MPRMQQNIQTESRRMLHRALLAMRIECDDLDKCLHCQGVLILESHTKTWHRFEVKHLLGFRCEKCGGRFESEGGSLQPKRERYERNSVAEEVAIRGAELETASNRRCPNCGGPFMKGGGVIFHCEWCYLDYMVGEGELVPRPPDPKPKSTMRLFYAHYEKR